MPTHIIPREVQTTASESPRMVLPEDPVADQLEQSRSADAAWRAQRSSEYQRGIDRAHQLETHGRRWTRSAVWALFVGLVIYGVTFLVFSAFVGGRNPGRIRDVERLPGLFSARHPGPDLRSGVDMVLVEVVFEWSDGGRTRLFWVGDRGVPSGPMGPALGTAERRAKPCRSHRYRECSAARSPRAPTGNKRLLMEAYLLYSE